MKGGGAVNEKYLSSAVSGVGDAPCTTYPPQSFSDKVRRREDGVSG